MGKHRNLSFKYLGAEDIKAIMQPTCSAIGGGGGGGTASSSHQEQAGWMLNDCLIISTVNGAEGILLIIRQRHRILLPFLKDMHSPL